MAKLNRNLFEIRKEIKEGVMKLLEDEIEPGGELEVFDEVIYGNRTELGRFTKNLPSLWVIPAPHTPTAETFNQEEHEFTWMFANLVRNNDHEAGRDESEELSSKVYDVVAGTEDRQLSGIVDDSYPGQILPAKDFQQNSGTFWSAFEFKFLYRRYRRSN